MFLQSVRQTTNKELHIQQGQTLNMSIINDSLHPDGSSGKCIIKSSSLIQSQTCVRSSR